jgi:hypothetical protein
VCGATGVSLRRQWKDKQPFVVVDMKKDWTIIYPFQ